MEYLINSCVSRIGQQLFGLICTAFPSGVKNEGADETERVKIIHEVAQVFFFFFFLNVRALILIFIHTALVLFP